MRSQPRSMSDISTVMVSYFGSASTMSKPGRSEKMKEAVGVGSITRHRTSYFLVRFIGSEFLACCGINNGVGGAPARVGIRGTIAARRN